MRIGFFTDYYLPTRTGVSFSVDSFRRQLEALGHEVYVFAPAAGLRVREEDDHIIRFPAIKGLFVENYMTTVFFPPQQVKKIENMHLDIIHFHTPSQIGLLGAHVAIRNDIPLISTYHTDLHEYTKTYPAIGLGFMLLSLLAPVITGGGVRDAKLIRPSLKSKVMTQKAVKQAMTLLHNYCDLVIAPSHKMELQLKRWKTQAHIEILPTGVDKITTTDEAVAARKHLYGLMPKDQVVMFTGRLGKEKNLVLLIKAFAKAKEKLPNLKLLLAGDFKHGEDLLDIAEQLGVADSIIKTGYIEHEELGSVLACADLFAFPSLTDTQSLVLNEAAHARLPLLAVDPLINDVLQDGTNGLIVKPTIAAFAAGIVKLISNKELAQRMGKASLQEAAKFTEAKQSKRLEELYEEVLEHHAEIHFNPFLEDEEQA